MAVRYSGDVVVRMNWHRRKGYVRVYLTDGQASFETRAAMRRKPTSEEYDALAARAIAHTAKVHPRALSPDVSRGQIRIRRIPQAPCPI